MDYQKTGAGRAVMWLGPAVAAALALQGCGGTEEEPGMSPHAEAATASRTFSCTQTTSSRGTYRQAVTGNLDASNVPHQVVVTRVQSGVVEISSPNPKLTANYDGGYWKRTYGLDAWYLGTVTVGYPPKSFYFNMPPSPGATFTALLKTDFGTNGSQGNWQHWMACTAQ